MTGLRKKTPAKKTVARKATAKMATAKKATAKKATAKKKPAKKTSAKKTQLRNLGEYFDCVAAGYKTMGLDNALDTYINMYEYEDHLAHDKLKQEARDVLDSGRLAEVMELATRRKIEGLTDATLRETLQRIADSERYVPIDE